MDWVSFQHPNSLTFTYIRQEDIEPTSEHSTVMDDLCVSLSAIYAFEHTTVGKSHFSKRTLGYTASKPLCLLDNL